MKFTKLVLSNYLDGSDDSEMVRFVLSISDYGNVNVGVTRKLFKRLGLKQRGASAIAVDTGTATLVKLKFPHVHVVNIEELKML